jgi:3D-(3,5/4)-trihydroxycyclohexane-1,2-dione acylhydrolase (decyclizing)
VLTSPAETGAVTLALPEDWTGRPTIRRIRPAHGPSAQPTRRHRLAACGGWIARHGAVDGGGRRVIYSQATDTFRDFVEQTGIPVGEPCGQGQLRFDHPLNLGAIGVTGNLAANCIARDADLVIGVGTRYSDFTTMSKTAFQNPRVRFVNLNVAEFDACKHHALALTGDAQAGLQELSRLLKGGQTPAPYRRECERLHRAWEAEVDRIYAVRHEPLPSQGELIGAVNTLGDRDAVMINAAGSMPGDLHKLWRAHPRSTSTSARLQLHGLRNRRRARH